MYHCHMHFYFAGQHCRAFEVIKEAVPFENFTHEFSWSEKPEAALVKSAGVIFANFQGADAVRDIEMLVKEKKNGTELIWLVGEGELAVLAEKFLSELDDVWKLPMTDHEIRFRFLRWQKACREKKDAWQTNHYLEATINNVPNMIWYKAKDGVHEKVNDSFCRIVNKTKEQVVGQRHAYIWDVEEDDPACIESERIVMTKQETCVSEECVQTRDGAKLLTTYKSPLYDLDGSVMGTVGVGIDVTQERAYEQEIMQKNRTLETIFTTMDCGIMCHTTDGARILSVNRAALKILDYETQEELVADGFDMVANSVLEEDKEYLRKSITELKTEGDSVSVEYRVQHKNGDILHVMGNVKLLKENGELLYQRFLLDCTAQKLQEQEHERRQVELVHALSIDYTLVCSFDLETGIGNRIRHEEDGDHTLEEIFDGELSLEESMERYIEVFVHEDDREEVREFICRKSLIQELTEERQRYKNYRTVKNGKVRYFQIKVVRFGAWMENRRIVLGFRSVDEEIRSEMEQKSLLENALMQANRANKAKSAFLSNMSHDIRTPMNAIVGFTALALTHIERKEQVKEYLKKIMTSGNHLLSLINDVLDMSRIESGKMHLEEKPCCLPDILHGLRNIVQADIHAKQQEFYIDTVDVFDEEIYCDKLRLNQVLLNLLSNAIKYTGVGGIITMRIIERAGAPEGYAWYEFYIRDTGIGMSEEFISHIFEPFEREKNTTIRVELV